MGLFVQTEQSGVNSSRGRPSQSLLAIAHDAGSMIGSVEPGRGRSASLRSGSPNAASRSPFVLRASIYGSVRAARLVADRIPYCGSHSVSKVVIGLSDATTALSFAEERTTATEQPSQT